MSEHHDRAEAGAKPKREISPARLAANRANSKRSCGPKTPRGKAVSKFNGLVHGMRAESEIIPGEDPAELDRRIAAWADELGAETGPERYLAEAAAGHGRLVFVAGESGAGKTAFVTRLIA